MTELEQARATLEALRGEYMEELKNWGARRCDTVRAVAAEIEAYQSANALAGLVIDQMIKVGQLQTKQGA